MANTPDRDRKIISLSNDIVEGYLRLHQPLAKCDMIIGLGSNVKLTALYCAELYQQGLAPKILFTGRSPSKQENKTPEALVFRSVAISQGVSPRDIITETKSTNTFENAVRSRKTLEYLDIHPNSAFIVCVPYHERRALATFRQNWPGVGLRVTSPPIDVETYIRMTGNNAEKFGREIIKELFRIPSYAKKGDILAQPPPAMLRRLEDSCNTLGKLLTPLTISDHEVVIFYDVCLPEIQGFEPISLPKPRVS